MKIKLLLMIEQNCDILILDEPTNHIDIHVREQLEEILEEFKGTIILVTHDRYMMEKVCNKLLVFENKEIKRYEYGLKEYLDHKEHEKSENNSKVNNNVKEQQILLDSRISYVLSKMSICKKDSDEYKDFEREYNDLIKKQKLQS